LAAGRRRGRTCKTSLPVPARHHDGPPASAAEPPPERRQIGRLMLFFALVYVAEGLGQTGGLIAQPLNYFLKQAYGWTPLQVTGWLSLLSLPWIIKPVYGIVSDFVPLLGYRRKAYLVLANAAATGACLLVTRMTRPGGLLLVLLLTAYAMAISSTLCGAVLVENGQRLRASDRFVNQQWLWFNIAAMGSGLVGGELVQRLSPVGALHAAAAIIAVAPLGAILGTLYLIDERPSRLDLVELRSTFRALLAAFTLRELWIIGLFLFLYYLNPGFGLPLYYYMTDSLKFSQAYIGILGAINSAGWIVAALLYRKFLGGMTSKQLLNASIVFGAVTTAAFLLLSNQASAAVINFFSGMAGMVAFVATLTLAADYCPKRAEGFAFAALMSLLNLSSAASSNIGSFLYEHAFHNRIAPLIVVSAASTALILVLVPLLRLGDKPPGEPVRAAAAG
ncbi:MAG: MFS transporter, partial [Stellaceae bacterium]